MSGLLLKPIPIYCNSDDVIIMKRGEKYLNVQMEDFPPFMFLKHFNQYAKSNS